jgi:hypothetical protein
MTEAEVIELSIGMGANAISSFTLFISITFAYLTLCHFLGAKLTKFQAATVSFVYLVGAGSPAVSTYGYLLAQQKLQSKYPSLMDSVLAINIDIWLIWLPVMTLCILAMSLYFMIQTRKADT